MTRHVLSHSSVPVIAARSMSAARAKSSACAARSKSCASCDNVPMCLPHAARPTARGAHSGPRSAWQTRGPTRRDDAGTIHRVASSAPTSEPTVYTAVTRIIIDHRYKKQIINQFNVSVSHRIKSHNVPNLESFITIEMFSLLTLICTHNLSLNTRSCNNALCVK